jgi:hypothetical protein
MFCLLTLYLKRAKPMVSRPKAFGLFELTQGAEFELLLQTLFSHL